MKKVVLIKNNYDDYLSYLMYLFARKIQIANKCEIETINCDEYDQKYGVFETPCILLVKNKNVKRSVNGFRYIDKIPIF